MNLRLITSYLAGVSGIFWLILGLIKDHSTMHSDMVVWGMLSLLFSVHLLNSDDINELKKEIKNNATT